MTIYLQDVEVQNLFGLIRALRGSSMTTCWRS